MKDIDRPSGRLPAAAIPAVSIGVLACGALAFGAIAIGALAVARLAVRDLAVKRARFHSVEIDELTVRRLRVIEDAPQPSEAKPASTASSR
jgi:hypothetical protein